MRFCSFTHFSHVFDLFHWSITIGTYQDGSCFQIWYCTLVEMWTSAGVIWPIKSGIPTALMIIWYSNFNLLQTLRTTHWWSFDFSTVYCGSLQYLYIYLYIYIYAFICLYNVGSFYVIIITVCQCNLFLLLTLVTICSNLKTYTV